ncbi:MAG: PLP-dependent aminotransferase family protein [Micromonosporaceae bacterium]
MTISFARGAPSVDIVDIAGLRAAAGRAFDIDPGAVAGYGPATGYPPLREWIAARHAVPVDRVLVTNGSLQGGAFLFEHLVRPGDEVVVERPTYDRTLFTLRNLGAKIHQVSLDADGLDVDELRKLLAAGVRPRLAHVIPNYQNPAGVTLSLSRRHALLELAREHDFVIFEDDPYAEIRFRGDRRPSMLSLAGAAVVHASSFTKTVCPGVRVGYLIGPEEIIEALARRAVNTYISPNMLAEVTVHQFCVSGDIERSIATVRVALAQRAAALAQALRHELPGCRFHEPDGGYFLWVDFGADVDVERLAPAALARGVAIVKGTDFLLAGGGHAARLAFSAVTPDEITEGVRRLAAAVADVRTR